jgi:hypothetical protein
MSAGYAALLDASSAASANVRALERLLRLTKPKTETGSIVYAELKAAEAKEKELRAAVRNHSEHSYDGL